MSELKRLKPTARILLTPEFRNGTLATIDPKGHAEETNFGRRIDLQPLREVIEATMRDRSPQDSDAWLGPRVHATLRLTRSEAADKAIWEYLNIVEFPNYVRWWWLKKGEPEVPVPMDRFRGEDSKNALGRLWWTAELTRNGNDYARSTRALAISRFSVSWLHLVMIHHHAAALAVVDFMHGLSDEGSKDAQGQAMAKVMNLALKTISLDSLADSPAPDSEAIREWIEEPVDVTTMMGAELPIGPDEAPVPDTEIQHVFTMMKQLSIEIGLERKNRTKTQ